MTNNRHQWSPDTATTRAKTLTNHPAFDMSAHTKAIGQYNEGNNHQLPPFQHLR